MPVIIPAIVGAATTTGLASMGGAFAVVTGTTAAGVAIMGPSLLASGIGLAAGFAASGLLAEKPEIQSPGPVDRSQMVRQTDAPREYVYGRTKKSGNLLFHYTSQDNKYFYMIVCVASHQIEEIETVIVNQNELTIAGDFTVDTDYTTTGITHYASSDDFYGENMWMDVSLGTSTNAANARFLQEIVQDEGDYLSTDKFNSLATIYFKFKWDPDVFNAIPQVQFVLKGKNDILDTRTSTTAYTANAALCLNDFLTDTIIGLGASTAEIETASINTAANVCDESVALNGGGTESRYTCNGVMAALIPLGTTIEAFLSTMAGSLIYVNGQFRLIAGAYVAPSVTITEDNLIGDINLSRPGKRDKFNAVKGLYINEAEEWIPTDFPYVTNSTYEAADGERIYKDLEFPLTISGATAQRIAKIDLERNRQDIIAELLIDLRNWDIAAGDTIAVTYAPFGWTAKVFDVLDRHFVLISNEGNGAFGIKLNCRETASTVYTWSEDETIVDPAPNTNLPNPFNVTAPSGLLLDSSEQWLIRGQNGRIVTRIKATWDPIVDSFVTTGGRFELQFKKSTDSIWTDSVTVDGALTEGFITDVDDRVAYDVRIRTSNWNSAKSAYVSSTNHTVIGKTTPPPNVTGFEASEVGGLVRFRWDQVGIADVYGYEIRYAIPGTPWKDGIPLTVAKQGTSESTISVPPGTWVFMIKVLDYVGLESPAAAAAGQIQVSNVNLVLEEIADNTFPGTLTDLIRHYTQVLTPDDQKLMSQYDNFDGFNTWVPTPVEVGYYTSEEIDLTTDTDIRVWGNIDSELGPGVTTGIADPRLQISYRSDSDSSAGADSTTNLIDKANGIFTNCLYHYTGVVVPDSNSLANAINDYSIFDNFVYDSKENCTYEGPEKDFGSDGNVFLDVTQGYQPGPGETGTAEASTLIDTKTSAGSYDGFASFTAGTFNLRYGKVKVEWNNQSNTSFVSNFKLVSSTWKDWIIGNINDVRYIQARIKLDTTVGSAKITDFNWTIDQ